MAGGDFGAWNVESLRLSIFHPPNPVSQASSGLWELVAGVPPENSDMRPREGVLQEQGAAFGNRLLLVMQGQRLDWSFVPELGPGSNQSGLPVLTGVDSLLPFLRTALVASLKVVGLVVRLAFGVALAQEAPTLAKARESMEGYLPFLDLQGQGGADLLYQINRARRSSVASHVLINRLSRWEIAEVQTGSFTVTAGMAPSFSTSDPAFVNKLMLDMNTVVGSSAISASRMPGLFDELAAFAEEIAIKGDIP